MLQKFKIAFYAIIVWLVLPSQAVAQFGEHIIESPAIDHMGATPSLSLPGIAPRQSAAKLTASQKARLTIEEYIKETGVSYCQAAIAPMLKSFGKAEGKAWNYVRRCEQGVRNIQRGWVPNPSARGGWINCASSQRTWGLGAKHCVGAWADLFVDPMGAGIGISPHMMEAIPNVIEPDISMHGKGQAPIGSKPLTATMPPIHIAPPPTGGAHHGIGLDPNVSITPQPAHPPGDPHGIGLDPNVSITPQPAHPPGDPHGIQETPPLLP